MTDGLQRRRQALRELCFSPAPHPGLVAEMVGRGRGGLWGRSPPDIEAMVGVRGVLGPLEQRPLKLDGDLGDRVGWQLNQHLQEVGLQPVLGRLVVDVTWRQARLKRHHTSFLGLHYLHLLLPLDLAPGGGLWVREARQAQEKE